MTVTIAGRRWKLRFVEKMRDYGRCDDPSRPHKEIRIRAGQSDFELCDTSVHEILHAAAYELLSEEWVAQTATDITKVLWRLGYRRQTPQA